MHIDLERVLLQMFSGHDIRTIIGQVHLSGKSPVCRHFELKMKARL